ncbi:MAG: monovalent cation/H+ antiporter subunit D family protein [Methanoregula sp.]|nr:monovalent cation/H+ antiporter subunit D family protein [Methanoregula sp.]
MIPDHLTILIVIIPLLGAYTTLLAGWVKRRFCFPIAMVTICIQFCISLALLYQVMKTGPLHYNLGNWLPPWGIEYVIDPLNGFVLVVLLFLSLLCCMYSKRSIVAEIEEKKIVGFYTVFLLLVAGVCGIAVTGDLFNLYVFLEISSLAAYALVASGREKKALFASFNYLIMGSVSACFILIGIGHLYIATGTLNMADLARLLPPLYGSPLIQSAFIFFIVGLSIKTALFPLHLWLPDAYSYAPSAVSALIATVMSKMGVYALIRILFTVFTPAFIIMEIPIMELFCWIAAIAIIVGSVLAITQTDLKMMLAYSSISQMGYILLGIGIANSVAMTGGILHILNHAVMKGCLFMVAGAIIYATGLRTIDDLKGISRTMPLTAAAFFIAAASMIGIPPTVGFMSKWFIALGALESGQWFFVVIILASSLLTAIYFWRVFEYMYFREPDMARQAAVAGANDPPASMLVPILILAAACILCGIFVAVPLEVIEPSVTRLLGGN